MAASQQFITDLNSVLTNGPSTTTTANAIAAGGPIMDYTGNVKLALLKAQELNVLITQIQKNTDNGTDGTNRTLLANILLSLV